MNPSDKIRQTGSVRPKQNKIKMIENRSEESKTLKQQQTQELFGDDSPTEVTMSRNKRTLSPKKNKEAKLKKMEEDLNAEIKKNEKVIETITDNIENVVNEIRHFNEENQKMDNVRMQALIKCLNFSIILSENSD